MAVQIVTWKDFQNFRTLFLKDLKELLDQNRQPGNESTGFLKTS